MKALKTIGILLLLLIVLGLIASLILPKDMHVERSITINAPADVVWKHISSHQAFDAWSPWNKIDSNMTKEMVGEDGVVGAIWKWESEDRNVGKGEQEFTVLDRESGKVETELRFDGMGNARSWRNMTEGDDGVTVTWGIHNDHIGIPWNLMMFLGGWESKAGDQFDGGLEDLKAICEADKGEPAKPEVSYEVQNGTFAGGRYIGIKELTKMTDIGTFIQTNMGKLHEPLHDKMVGAPVALYFTWDEENGETEMAVAVPVAADAEVGDLEEIMLDSSNTLYIDYFGSYEASESAHIWMGYHMKTEGIEMKQAPVIEAYMNDPMSEPDTAKWHTRIIYPVN